jgi:hypothetical protein
MWFVMRAILTMKVIYLPLVRRFTRPVDKKSIIATIKTIKKLKSRE